MDPTIYPSTRAFLNDLTAFAGRRRVAGVVLLMLAGGMVEGLSLALLVPLLALLTGDGTGRLQVWANGAFAAIGATTPFARLAVVVGGFAAAMIVRAVVLMIRDRAIVTLQTRYIADKRVALLNAVADAPWRQVAGLRHARVTNALTGEIGRIALAAQATLHIAVAVIMLAVQFALTLAISPKVGLLALAALGGAGIVFSRRLRVAELHGAKLGRDGLSLVHTTAQLLGGLKQAAAENRQRDFVDDFAATSAGLVDSQLAYQRRVTRFQLGTSVAIAVACAVALLVGAWLEQDRAALLATLVILFRMVTPAVGIQHDAETLAMALPAHRAVAELARELAVGGGRPAAAAPIATGALELANVTFLHDERAGIRELALTIAPGEIVGLVGPSGAGKTTLVDVMVGLIVPQSGGLKVGGNVVDDVSAAAWRDRIAYVGQDAFLISDTIRRNLSRANGDPGDAAIWAALTTAAAADVVRAMPDGLDTMLAERGSRLSGGERQRIAIARALLRRPALLVLDEATNAIDIATEDRLLAALSVADPAMMIVVVAHRGETLRRCTRIVRIEDGRLVADERPAAG